MSGESATTAIIKIRRIIISRTVIIVQKNEQVQESGGDCIWIV